MSTYNIVKKSDIYEYQIFRNIKMFSYLGINSKIQYGLIQIPGWRLLDQNLSYNINKAENYYHTQTTYNFENSLIKSLISKLYIPLDIDAYSFYNNVMMNGIYTTTTLGITSSVSSGKIHKGVFYGDYSDEFVLATSSELDLNYVQNNWRKLKPIRVLRHDYDRLSYININGKNNYSNKNVAVIKIDVSELFMMYYYWYQEEKRKHLEEGTTMKNTGHFVSMWLTPGIIESHNDCVIMNKYYNRARDLPDSSTVNYRPPFFTIDIERELDEKVAYQVNKLKTSKLPGVQVMQNSYVSNGKNALSLMSFGDDLINFQNKWLWFLSVFKYYIYILNSGEEKSQIKRNKFLINSFNRQLDRMISDGSFSNSILSPIKDKLIQELKDIKTIS